MSDISTPIAMITEPSTVETARARIRRPLERASLCAQRRALVSENIGLVHVHMKHSVARMQAKWTQREWEDLVQEGCLGLIRAAQDFNPKGTIPFAAFALPRIHTAIRRAMLRRPAVNERCFDPAAITSIAARESAARRVRRPAPEDPLEILGDWHGAGRDTVGLRLREKLDRAVRRAVEELSEERTDVVQRKTLQALADGRHLVPDAHARKPYRRLAAELAVPYSRITHCDRRLRAAIARTLSGDPEFVELQRIVQSAPEGVEARADPELEGRLARLSAAELLQRLICSPDHREKVFPRLGAIAPPSLFEALERELANLPAETREDLLGRCDNPNVSAV